jgi:hypothetical protein
MRAAPTPAALDRIPNRLQSLAGPLLIVALVLVIRRDIAFHHALPTSDLTRLWLPTYDFLGRRLAGGHIPGWDPNLFAGRAFAADPQSGWMYAPPMMLFSLIDAGWAMRVMVLMQPVLAGVGLYGFLRAERFQRSVATLAGLGLAGALSSSQLVLALPFSAVFAWNAVALWALARAFMTPRLRTAGLWLALAAAATGQAAAAHLSTGLAMHLMVVGGYLALQVARRRGDRRAMRSALVAVLAYAALVAGLSAAYVVPRLAQLPDTSLADGYAAAWNLARSLADLAPQQAPLGQRAATSWPLTLTVIPGPHVPALLLCAVPAALAALRSGTRSGLVRALTVVGLVGYLLSLAAVADAVPDGWRRFRLIDLYLHGPSWFADLTLLCIVALGAIGLERLLSAAPRRGAALAAIATFAIAVAAVLAGCSPSQLALFTAVGVASALVLAVPRAATLAGPLLVALATAELLIGAAVDPGSTALTRALPRKLQPVDVAHPYRDPQPDGAVARMLRAGGGRVLFGWHDRSLNIEADTGLPPPLDGTLNGPLADAVETVGGYNAVQPLRYWRYARALVRPVLPYNRTVIDRPDVATLDLLDVAWMVLPAGERPPVAATAGLSSNAFTLWKLQAAPRAQLFSNWTTVSSQDEAREALFVAHGFDPSRTLIVESGAPSGAGGTAGTAGIVERSDGRLVIGTVSDTPEMLLVRQSYDPFWHATVDGRPATVRVADSFEPSLLVPPGRHRVVLAYDDPWIVRGLIISGLALAVWLAACAAAGRRASPLPVAD